MDGEDGTEESIVRMVRIAQTQQRMVGMAQRTSENGEDGREDSRGRIVEMAWKTSGDEVDGKE